MDDVEAPVASNGVDVSPPDVVRRYTAGGVGIRSDTIQVIRREPYEYRYKGPCHLLIMSERQERDDGETLVEGLAKSNLRVMNQKLTLVPAGYEFSGWQAPRTLSRYTYFYLDPHGIGLDPDLRFTGTELKPRLFFFDQDLWATLQKLRRQLEGRGRMDRAYVEALSIVLAHEVLRLDNGVAPAREDARGGLAGWQKKKVVEYIEENLADDLVLAQLAKVAGLSPFHFARAFKESLGLPPRRYVTSRRIEKAKALLAQPDRSVTQVGAQLGFGDTSSFSTAFRQHTGTTPTAYRRILE